MRNETTNKLTIQKHKLQRFLSENYAKFNGIKEQFTAKVIKKDPAMYEQTPPNMAGENLVRTAQRP